MLGGNSGISLIESRSIDLASNNQSTVGPTQVRSKKTSAPRCCLIIYSRRPRCNATNSWDPKLISGYDLTGRSRLGAGPRLSLIHI